MLCTLDLEGRFLSVNRAGEALTGFTEDELVGTLALELIAPEVRQDAVRQFQRRLSSGDETADETVLVARDGRRVPIEVTSTLVSVDGEPARVLGLIRDLTERRNAASALEQSEDRLLQSEQRFRSSFESAPIGMALVALDGLFIKVNESLCDLVGYTADELVTKTFQQITHPDDLDLDLEYVRRMLAGDLRTYQMEKRYLNRDGGVVWILLSVSLVRARDGSPLHFISQIQDITERKRAHDELEASKAQLAEAQQRFRSLVEQLPLGTYVRPLDMSEPNIYASPQVEPLVGYPASAWETDPGLLARILHPDDRERVLGHCEDFRRTGEPLHDEFRLIARDGRTVWVQDEAYVVADEDGGPSFIQGFLLDITERKLAEAERDRLREELHHAQKLEAIGRLAGGVAHDFNNMLTAIKGYSELLVGALDPDDPNHAHAAQIKRAAEQASQLPRQLLAFSRRQTLEPELVSLNDVVSGASELLRHLVTEAVELVVVHGSGCADAHVDPSQIEHVLVNLALNAREAMPGGGKLTISTRNAEVTSAAAAKHDIAPGSYIVISVGDTGHGMDEATRARAFEPFFTTRPDAKGSGLGLASVYGTVTQSGGFIDLTTAPGRGTTFDIYLPRARTTAAASAAPGSHGRRPTALVAEDEEIVRDLATSVLEQAGIEVHAAVNGEEALDLYRRVGGSIDVLVTDMIMPSVGGRELAKRIHSTDPGLPMVFMSGYTEDAPPVDGSDASSSFLQKPFSASDLVGAVRAVIRERGGRPPAAPAHFDASPAPCPLTPRECEILGLVAEGLTNDKVAAELAISPETVQSHVRNSMSKLGADTRTQAVATAVRRSLI